MFKEFKEFISKGNVIDLAVGVIIGGAFGKIVNSLVDSIIMPVLGLILGKINFQELKLVLKQSDGVNPELAISYGLFIQNIIKENDYEHTERTSNEWINDCRNGVCSYRNIGGDLGHELTPCPFAEP